MKLTAKYRKKDKIAGRHIAGESFLIPVCGRPVDMDSIFILNPLADFIWQRLDGDHTVDAILADVIENFDVEYEQARMDAGDFLGELLKKELVEEVA